MSRSIATQTIDELGGPRSVLARKSRDHVQLDRLLHQLEATAGTPQLEVLQRIDRLVVDDATRRGPDRFAPAGRALSGGLAFVAGWVERMPSARRGDRAATSR